MAKKQEKKSMAGKGHNSTRAHPAGVAVDQLKTIIKRIETLEEEKAGLSADIREVYSEAKGNGFDTKTIKQIIKLRKIDQEERDEQEAMLFTYRRALGMESALEEML